MAASEGEGSGCMEESQPSLPATPDKRARRRVGIKFTRDGILFTGGLAGVFYETVFTKADRPTLLILFAAMMGLPAFLRTDENRKSPPDK